MVYANQESLRLFMLIKCHQMFVWFQRDAEKLYIKESAASVESVLQLSAEKQHPIERWLRDSVCIICGSQYTADRPFGVH